MKSNKIVLVVSLLFLFGNVNAQGIDFFKTLSWDEVLKKAKNENKYIFVDCYATWCKPCKEMDKNVFNKDTVGAFFNKNFVSVKLQFDTAHMTVNDTIWRLRPLAQFFEKKYEIDVYPHYLFFNSDGQMVAKESGLMQSKSFLAKAALSLDPEEQYYLLRERYLNGDTSIALAKKIVPKAIREKDFKIAFKLHDRFVESMDTPYTKANLIALYASIPDINGKGIKFLMRDPSSINKILGDEGRSQSVIKTHLVNDCYKRFISRDQKNVDWPQLKTYLYKTADDYADQVFLNLQADVARGNQDWELFGKLKMDYFDKYAKQFDHNEKWFMNNELMDVFVHCHDKEILMRAAEWSKYTIYIYKEAENPYAMDTYANLLYKAGEKNSAIWWQKRAVAIRKLQNEADNELVQTLNKMLEGKPTWINN